MRAKLEPGYARSWVTATLVGVFFGAITQASNLGFGPCAHFISLIISSASAWILMIHLACLCSLSLIDSFVRGTLFMAFATIAYSLTEIVCNQNIVLTPSPWIAGVRMVLGDMSVYGRLGVVVVAVSTLVVAVSRWNRIVAIPAAVIMPALALWSLNFFSSEFYTPEGEYKAYWVLAGFCLLFMFLALGHEIRGNFKHR